MVCPDPGFDTTPHRRDFGPAGGGGKFGSSGA